MGRVVKGTRTIVADKKMVKLLGKKKVSALTELINGGRFSGVGVAKMEKGCLTAQVSKGAVAEIARQLGV